MPVLRLLLGSAQADAAAGRPEAVAEETEAQKNAGDQSSVFATRGSEPELVELAGKRPIYIDYSI